MARLKRRQFIECDFTSCTPAKVVEYRRQANALTERRWSWFREDVGKLEVILLPVSLSKLPFFEGH
jgi:hypothetical protein